MDVKSFINKIKESNDFKKFQEELDEMSVTGMVAGYQTPKAFAANDDDFEEHNKETAEVYGYKLVPKTKKRNYESVYKQTMRLLNEASVSVFSSDGDEFKDGVFHKDEDTWRKYSPVKAETSGYKLVNEKNVFGKTPEKLKSVKEYLSEASYKEFRRDETRTTNRKINDSIKNINRIMYEVEKVVEHASRLKTEMAVDERTLWRESKNRLVKISERINRISKKIHELGA